MKAPAGPPPPGGVARRRIRLVWSLLAVMLATALVPLLISAFVLIDINRESLESGTREYQLQLAGSLASRLDAALTTGGGHVSEAVAALDPIVARERGDRAESEAIRALLQPHLTDVLVQIRYTSQSGSLVQVGAAQGLDAQAIQEGYFEAFALAMEGVPAPALPVRLAPGGEDQGPRPGAIVSAPVHRGGKPAGAVAAVLDLSGTWMRGVNDVAADYAVLALDREGGILAQANLPGDLAGGAYRKLEIVQRFLKSSIKSKETMPVTAPGGMFGRRLLGASVPTDYGWGLFVLVDQDLAYHAATEMRRQVTKWSLFAVLLAVLAAVVSAGLITRPLGALVEGARRLARGDFGQPVASRSRSEIGELADTFNFMSEEIQNHVERLRAAAEENHNLFLGTIRALAAAIDEKDPYTRGHSERVNRYAVSIAKHMGLPKTEMTSVTVAALLHDVGKIGIEDAILRKPDALTDREFEVMKRHPEKGAHIMGAIPQMREIIPGIRNHHERWTGGGYPDNLKGEEIPLVARIVQVADTFDAMTTTRPYQRAMKAEAGVARIRELGGIVFDPKVVDAFLDAWAAGDLKVEPRPEVRPAAAPAAEGTP